MATSARARLLARLRRLARALPGASETTSFGHPTFRAGKKSFAVVESYGGEDVVCFKATLEDQALLVLDPRFDVAPYVGRYGWTSMRTGEGLDPVELEELIRESYRLVASKRMLSELDESGARPRPRRHTKSK